MAQITVNGITAKQERAIVALLNEHPAIERSDLEAGLALWRYCDASAEYLFGNRLGNPDADKLLTELRRARQLDRTQIRDVFQRNKSAEEINRLLGVLESRGLAKKTIEQTEGRPREVWWVIE